ncbi:cytochrome P450 [Natrialbaceae archaeon A-arb3/5]
MSDSRSTADDRDPTTPDDTTGSDPGASATSNAAATAARGTTPPGPRGRPLIGHTLSFGRDPIAFLDGLREYGDVVRYEAFGREFVVLFDPDLVERVLVSRDDEFWRGEFENEFSNEIDVEGVFFAEGDRWRQQRRLLQQAFTPARIESYAGDMVAETERLVEGWAAGQVVDLREELSALTLDVLTRSLFDFELGGDRAARIRRWVHAMGEYSEREALGARSLLPEWVPTKTKREYARATADVETLVAELVAERRRSGADGDDLLTLLATGEYPDGSQPTVDEISDQLMLFLLAGHETTATALTYVCWLLAADDETRGALECEVENVCGDRDPTVGDLPELSVTEAVGREAMRLYPPLPFLQREPHEEITLGGYRLGPDTTVQLAVYSIHRDGRWWDDPVSFRPDRWLDADGQFVDDTDDRPEYAYFPFGGGSRHCIGMRFAMTELQLTLATMAQRVAFDRVTESIDPQFKVSLDPGPVEMRVRKR